MASSQIIPTRMELAKQKKKLATATRGHKLLKDKRDALMRQFLDLVRENKALREKVEAALQAANKNFVLAKASTSDQVLNAALLAPKQEVYLETDTRNVMSVDIPVFHYKTRTADANDIYSYGFAFSVVSKNSGKCGMDIIVYTVCVATRAICPRNAVFCTIFCVDMVETDGCGGNKPNFAAFK